MTVAEAKADTEIEFGRLKDAFKELQLSDVSPILLSSINIMKELGNFTIAVGELEKKKPASYEVISQLSENPETILMSFINKIPEEKLKPLISFTLELASIQTKLNNIKNLTADEKIQLGKDLKAIVEKISNLIGEISH